MIIPSRFQPAWWLRGGHAQTIWPTLLRPRVRLPVRRERVLLADGDFIDVDWAGEMGPIVIVLHGLAGSIDSHYARGMLRAFARRGWRGALLHFRGCSGEPNRLPRSYHAGDPGALNALVELLRAREPARRHRLIYAPGAPWRAGAAPPRRGGVRALRSRRGDDASRAGFLACLRKAPLALPAGFARTEERDNGIAVAGRGHRRHRGPA